MTRQAEWKFDPVTGHTNTAVISSCGKYRYDLTRENLIPGNHKIALLCGLNPSTADALKEDRTSAKGQKFAVRWGCGRLVIVNGSAYRTTYPSELAAQRKAGFDVVGPDNDATIRRWCEALRIYGGKLVVGWGQNIDPARQVELAYLFDEEKLSPMCLGINKDGSPEHPLYIPYARELVPWSCP